MKIGYVTQYLSPEFGGPIKSLLLELSKRIEVLNFSSMRRNIQYYSKPEYYSNNYEELNKNLRICRYSPLFELKGLVFPGNLGGLLEREKLELMHCDEYYQPTTHISFRHAKRNKLPFILNQRGNEIRSRHLHERLFFRIANPVSKKIVYGADKVICLTYPGREVFLRIFPGIEEKVIVIPNSIDPSLFENPDASRFRERYNIPENRPVILCVARIQPQKRIDLLIRIFSIVKKTRRDAILVIAGPWDDNEKIRVDSIIRDLNLKDIVFTGPIPNDKIRDTYDSADVIVLTSEFEPFGYCLLEAMCAKKPVIGFSVGGIPDIIGDEISGYLIPFPNLEKFAERISELIEDKKKGMDMGANGRKIVDEKFALNMNAGRLIEIYEEALQYG